MLGNLNRPIALLFQTSMLKDEQQQCPLLMSYVVTKQSLFEQQ